jgi:hypothetical protein
MAYFGQLSRTGQSYFRDFRQSGTGAGGSNRTRALLSSQPRDLTLRFPVPFSLRPNCNSLHRDHREPREQLDREKQHHLWISAAPESIGSGAIPVLMQICFFGKQLTAPSLQFLCASS